MAKDSSPDNNELPDYSDRIAIAARAVLKKEVKHLQLIPAAAIKLLKLTNDENTRAKDLSRLIETEPALAAKVIRTVNSAAFFLPKKITSIKHAVNMLGFSEVRRTALDQLFYNKLIRYKAKKKFDQLFFWQHCLFVASLSKAIAVALKHPDPDMIYTGGLLHDIGKIVFEEYGKVTYSDFLEALEKTDCSQLESERTFFGLTHSEMGQVFAYKWNLPVVIRAIITYHHELPDDASLIAQYNTEIAIVSFANYIAWIQGVGSGQTLHSPNLQEKVLKIVEVDKLDLVMLLEKVDREMTNTRDFYGIEFPNVHKLRAQLVQATIRLSCMPPKAHESQPSPQSAASSLTIPHRSLNPDDFVPWTLEAIYNDFNFDRVIMLTINPNQRSLVASYCWPVTLFPSETWPLEIPIDQVSGGLLECLRSKKPVLINKNDQDKKILQLLKVDEFIALPVIRNNRFVGLIYADNALSSQKMSVQMMQEMMPIVKELGVAFLNAKQYSMAKKESQIDPLSQLNNKRVINEFLALLFAAEASVLNKIAIGFIDIDRFKLFNDACGHQAGDDVLKTVADILRSLSRPEDFIGRYGGEEFLFVLRNTDAAGALGYAERIRKEIEKRGQLMSQRFHHHELTVSVGLAMYTPEFKNYQELIEAADKAMYRAKNEGRNRVVIYRCQGQ